MVWVASKLVYGIQESPEESEVAFPLPTDLWSDAGVTHAVLSRWFAVNEYLELVDAHGDLWPFYRGTVRAFATWEAQVDRIPGRE